MNGWKVLKLVKSEEEWKKAAAAAKLVWHPPALALNETELKLNFDYKIEQQWFQCTMGSANGTGGGRPVILMTTTKPVPFVGRCCHRGYVVKITFAQISHSADFLPVVGAFVQGNEM